MLTKIPGILKNGVVSPLKKIEGKPKNIFIFLEYENIKSQKKEKVNLNNLVGIIDKNYKDNYKDHLLNKYN